MRWCATRGTIIQKFQFFRFSIYHVCICGYARVACEFEDDFLRLMIKRMIIWQFLSSDAAKVERAMDVKIILHEQKSQDIYSKNRCSRVATSSCRIFRASSCKYKFYRIQFSGMNSSREWSIASHCLENCDKWRTSCCCAMLRRGGEESVPTARRSRWIRHGVNVCTSNVTIK